MVIFREFAGQAPPTHVPRMLHLHLLLSSWVAAGADLLEEHLGEIWNLCQRLEESIFINDRLQEQLEHSLSFTACRSSRRGPGPPISGLFRENLEVALGKNFADFTALWSAFLHLLLTVSNTGTRTIPLPLWWYLIQRVTLLTADQTRSASQNSDISSILNLLIHCLLPADFCALVL